MSKGYDFDDIPVNPPRPKFKRKTSYTTEPPVPRTQEQRNQDELETLTHKRDYLRRDIQKLERQIEDLESEVGKTNLLIQNLEEKMAPKEPLPEDLAAKLAELSLRFKEAKEEVDRIFINDEINIVLSEVEERKMLKGITLSEDQSDAWQKLKLWIRDETSQFFELKGYAGTGKTFLMKLMTTQVGVNLYFTSPTNKATKVLGQMIGVSASTTFSLLGLRMEAEEEKMELKMPKEPPQLGSDAIIVVDETSMASEPLVKVLQWCVEEFGVRIAFVGDPAQLPPVGEEESSAWGLADKENRFLLKKVMRYDNQLLTLSTRIRSAIKTEDFRSVLIGHDCDKNGGVRVVQGGKRAFVKSFLKKADKLEYFDERKILAWRNKTVDSYNETVRNHFGLEGKFAVGERILLGSPLNLYGEVVETVDTEMVIESVTEVERSFTIEHSKPPLIISTFSIEANTGTAPRSLSTPIYMNDLQKVLSVLATRARSASRTYERKNWWDKFWEVKNAFQDIRYNYALTVHRSQGSSYKTVFTDQADILANPNKFEALRCLYVACTRASKYMVTY